MTLELTTIARIKTRLGITGSGDDTELTQHMRSISLRMEREMRRHVAIASRTEVYELNPARGVLALKGFPVDLNVSPSFSIKVNDSDRDFSTIDALTINEDYAVDATNGLVRLYTRYAGSRRATGRLEHPLYVQVIYSGGMAADEGSPSTTAANIIADYPDLAQACDDQVSYFWKRRTNLGSNQTLQGSTAMFEEAYRFLPTVMETLAYYSPRYDWAA